MSWPTISSISVSTVFLFSCMGGGFHEELYVFSALAFRRFRWRSKINTKNVINANNEINLSTMPKTKCRTIPDTRPCRRKGINHSNPVPRLRHCTSREHMPKQLYTVVPGSIFRHPTPNKNDPAKRNAHIHINTIVEVGLFLQSECLNTGFGHKQSGDALVRASSER